MANPAELNMDDVRHQIALNGIDECKLFDIVSSAKRTGVITAPSSNEAFNIAEVMVQLERLKLGGLANAVEQVHESLVTRGVIRHTPCPNVVKAGQRSVGVL